jgi:DNA-directed RNA polymerase subunit K
VIKYTKYEKARIIGARALQISMGAPFMIKLSEEDLVKHRYNPIEIAKLEFAKDLIPIAIKKPAPRTHAVETDTQSSIPDVLADDGSKED